jgi:hypothetical protein
VLIAPTRALRGAGLFVCALLAAAHVAAADTPTAGYQLAMQDAPVPFALTCSLPDGDLVTFDGQNLDRWTASGAFVANLATLPSLLFVGSLSASPDGSLVVFGESSHGDLFVAQSDGSGFTPLVNLPFNYDSLWLSSNELIVSAAIGGWGTGNDLVRVIVSPPSATSIGHVDGASGPVALAPNGDLYYATQSDQPGPPPDSTDVLRWSAAQVLAGGLSELNAQTICAGFDGGSSLAFDPVVGRVYLAETNFGMGLNRIVRVASTPATSPTVVDGVSYISDLDLLPGGGLGSFDPWQPADGRLLRYNAGFEIGTLRPRRPVLVASGPGLTGPGLVTFTVHGGVPNGTMFMTACPQNFVLPSSAAYALPTFLLVTPFTLNQTRRGPSLVPLDASGKGSFNISNSGNLQGQYAWQFLVGDANGVFLGSSTVVQF